MTRSVLAIAAAALALACCSAEPQLRARAYDLDAAMPPLADDVNADAQQGTGGGSSGTASAAQSESFTVSKGRDINAPMDNVILIGDQKPNGSAPSGDEKGDVNAPMVLSATDIQDERQQVHAEGREARSAELRKAEDKMIRHTLLDYNPRKRKWMKPSPRLAKICPREMKFASFVSSRFALLKTWCADVDADQCRACAVRRQMELSDKDNGNNMQLDKCESIKVSFLCDNMAEALNEQISRWKHKTAYVQPLFRPKAGFRTAYGEMAACVLGKAEAVLDTLYSLTHCKAGQWSDQKGEDCYRNTVKDLDKDIGQCCAGYEHIVLFEMEATCDSAILPVLKPIRKLLKKAWDRCIRDPQSCSLVRKKYDKCLKMAQKFSSVPRKPTGEGGVACDYAYSFGGARKIFKLTVKAAHDLYAAGGDPRDISPIANKLLHACDRGEPFCSEYIIRFLMKYDEAIGNRHDQ